jgi:hypothetical protein
MKQPVLLAIVSASMIFLPGNVSFASDNWTELQHVDVGASGVVDYYADLSTIQQRGNRARIMTLDDFNNRRWGDNSHPTYSIVSSLELDCNAKKVRILSWKRYTANMGAGEVKWNFETANAKFESFTLSDKVPAYVAFKAACRK